MRSADERRDLVSRSPGHPEAIATGFTAERLAGQRRWNIGLGVLPAGLDAGVTTHREKTYLVLSLAARSLLAWQIFGGSLAD